MTNKRLSKSVSSAPYWLTCRPAREHDIRRLLPASLPKGERFETDEDARAESAARLEVLKKGSRADGRLATRLCHPDTDGSERCQSPADSQCARLHRIWSTGAFHEVLDPFGLIFIIHLLFPERVKPFGQLDELTLETIKNTLYQQIGRILGRQAVVVGALEVAAKSNRQKYLPHAHIAVANIFEETIERLRKRYPKDEEWGPLMMVQQVTDADRPRQINYLSKFTTLHRPMARTGAKRAKAVRLPTNPHNELMQFYDRHAFEDFLFLFNVRRAGKRLHLSSRVEL